MRKHNYHLWCLIFTLLVLSYGCAQNKPASSSSVPPSLDIENQERANEQEEFSDEMQMRPLDPAIREKVHVTFAPLFAGDEKKAKLAFGRYYRYIPDSLQFALDLRFQNFEHAMTVLPNLHWAKSSIEFWTKIIGGKSPRLIKNICEELKNQTDYPPENLSPSSEEKQWSQDLRPLSEKIISENIPASDKVSPLEEQLIELSCDTLPVNPREWSCRPMSQELIKAIMKDSFFSRLHNLQRRDIRNLKEIFRNPLKHAEYRRNISVEAIYKLYLSVKATEFPRQKHFLKRFRGLALDMRRETLHGRLTGNYILAADDDVVMVTRFKRFSQLHPIINLLIPFDYDLAECGLSGRLKSR